MTAAGRITVMVCCTVIAACGADDGPSAGPTPLPRPDVALTAAERSTWAPGPALRSAVPVLAYRRLARAPAEDAVDPRQFARQMLRLHHAGYRTITLPTFVRFLRGEPVRLPARPFLLTFDDARLDAWMGGEAILRELGFKAVVFVDAGRVDRRDPRYLSWAQLRDMQRTGRWDVQLQAGTGNLRIKWGPKRDDLGSFYTYRGTEEVLGGWRERVFGDFAWAERQLAFRVPGYRPLAIAPPDGNYGQAGTNDPRIPRLLLARLLGAFQVVFTYDRPALASGGAGLTRPVGRLQVTRSRGDRELRALLGPEAAS